MSYLTVKDVAEKYQCSQSRIRRLTAAGRLRYLPLSPKIWRYRPQDLPETLPEIERPSRKGGTLPTSGVYMLFLDGALIYVGRSTELPRRITNHRRAGRVFDGVQAIPCPPEVADWLEAELVRTLQPPENIKRFTRRAQRMAPDLAEMGL